MKNNVNYELTLKCCGNASCHYEVKVKPGETTPTPKTFTSGGWEYFTCPKCGGEMHTFKTTCDGPRLVSTSTLTKAWSER